MKLPSTPSFRLDNRRALVAGASSGIGLGCAVALAEAGAEVTLAARRAEPLEETVAALREAGHKAQAMVLSDFYQDSTDRANIFEPRTCSMD